MLMGRCAPSVRSLAAVALVSTVLAALPSELLLARPPSPPHGSGGRQSHVPWWRMPLIHTTTEQWFFLRLMESQYGPGWLRWMPDSVIEAHWRRFLMSWPYSH